LMKVKSPITGCGYTISLEKCSLYAMINYYALFFF